MNTILALALGSALVGFLVGQKQSVVAMALTTAMIAVAAALAVRGLDFLPAVGIAFTSVWVSQVAYLIGVWLRMRSITEKSDDDLRDDC
jgi:hypothetical protein